MSNRSFKEFISEKRFSHTGEGLKRGWDSPEKWRGPHEGKEHDMMVAGVKPAALVNHDEYHKKFERHVKSGKMISKPISDYGNGWKTKVPNYIVGLKGQEKRVEKLHQEFSKNTRDHKKIGVLLGYTKEHIRKFANE